MTISKWTPNGWQLKAAGGAEYQRQLLTQLRQLVRDTAYNVCRLENGPADETYSRAVDLYRQAATAYRMFETSEDFEQFMKATYKPKCGHGAI